MLPPGVMKGGAAMSVRVGEACSRFTTDLDAARSSHVALDDYLDELGHDEIGSTDAHELRIAEEIVDLFATVGLDEPQPIALITVAHQMPQKLRACTTGDSRTGGNDRAHDVGDLQILEREEAVTDAVAWTNKEFSDD